MPVLEVVRFRHLYLAFAIVKQPSVCEAPLECSAVPANIHIQTLKYDVITCAARLVTSSRSCDVTTSGVRRSTVVLTWQSCVGGDSQVFATSACLVTSSARESPFMTSQALAAGALLASGACGALVNAVTSLCWCVLFESRVFTFVRSGLGFVRL